VKQNDLEWDPVDDPTARIPARREALPCALALEHAAEGDIEEAGLRQWLVKRRGRSDASTGSMLRQPFGSARLSVISDLRRAPRSPSATLQFLAVGSFETRKRHLESLPCVSDIFLAALPLRPVNLIPEPAVPPEFETTSQLGLRFGSPSALSR
jgi:hypothetical protein